MEHTNYFDPSHVQTKATGPRGVNCPQNNLLYSQSHLRLPSPEELSEHDTKLVLKTAKEIECIHESTQDEYNQAAQRVFKGRNLANKKWMEIDYSAKKERSVNFIDTEIAILEAEEDADFAIEAAEHDLTLYNSEADEKMQLQRCKADLEKGHLERDTLQQITLIKTQVTQQNSKGCKKIEDAKIKASEEVQLFRTLAENESHQNDLDTEEQIRKIQEETARALAALTPMKDESNPKEEAKVRNSGKGIMSLLSFHKIPNPLKFLLPKSRSLPNIGQEIRTESRDTSRVNARYN